MTFSVRCATVAVASLLFAVMHPSFADSNEALHSNIQPLGAQGHTPAQSDALHPPRYLHPPRSHILQVVADQRRPHFRLTTASLNYDFEVQMRKPCDLKANDGICDGPGIIEVFGKGATAPMQALALANIVVSVGGDGQPIANIPGSSVVYVEDVNFDGHDDLVIRDGNAGSYGSPSYTIYVFDPGTGRFIENASVSALTHHSMGLFEVDKRARQLQVWDKHGCCNQTTTRYRVVNNRLLPVSRREDSAVPGSTRRVITEDLLVNGQWERQQHDETAIKIED